MHFLILTYSNKFPAISLRKHTDQTFENGRSCPNVISGLVFWALSALVSLSAARVLESNTDGALFNSIIDRLYARV